MKKEYAIRGAVCIPFDNPKDIDSGVSEMMNRLYSENKIGEEDVAFVLFSQTGDLKSKNAAAAFRQSGLAGKTPLFCVAEAEVSGSLRKVIRVLVLVAHEEQNPVHHVYINGAEVLRPDYSN